MTFAGFIVFLNSWIILAAIRIFVFLFWLVLGIIVTVLFSLQLAEVIDDADKEHQRRKRDRKKNWILWTGELVLLYSSFQFSQ